MRCGRFVAIRFLPVLWSLLEFLESRQCRNREGLDIAVFNLHLHLLRAGVQTRKTNARHVALESN